MHFIQITESVTTEDVTCKATGLTALLGESMETVLKDLRVNCCRDHECIEAETSGVTILNVLGSFDYKLYSQAMAIEVSHIGGRDVMVQKIVWTMGK